MNASSSAESVKVVPKIVMEPVALATFRFAMDALTPAVACATRVIV